MASFGLQQRIALALLASVLGALFLPIAVNSQENVARQVVSVGQAQIEVRSQGDGDVVVVLSGAGAEVSYLDRFGASVAANGLRVLAINPRGAGSSRGRMSDLTLHDYASDVAGVLEALSIEKATILGFGAGNRIARTLAADRPDLVLGLVLVAAGGLVPGDPNAVAMMQMWAQEEGTFEERMSAFRASMLSPATDAENFDLPIVVPAAFAAYSAANAATPLDEWWSGGTAQMLVLQGEDDLIAPMANGEALSAEFGSRVKLVNIPDAGHMLLVEQSDAVAAEMLRFIEGLR